MNILQNIEEMTNISNAIELLIAAIGIMLFISWLRRTRFGSKALLDSRPRRNWMPLILPLFVIFAIFLFIGITTQLAEKILTDNENSNANLISNILSIITGIISIIAILLFVRIFFARGVKGIGLNIKTIVRDLGFAFVYLISIWPIMTIIILAVMSINQIFISPEYEMPVHQELQNITVNHDIWIRISIAFMTIVITPFLEELLFRGLFQSAIRTSLNVKHAAWIAIFITSIFFAINHANFSHWPILFVLAACMGYSYEKSGSLFQPIFIHMIFNASSIIATWFSNSA